MTSSQEPPLTRREMRERERLLAQQAESSTADAVPAPMPPTSSPVPQQAFPSAPVPQPAPVVQPASIPQPAAMPPVAPTPPPPQRPTPSAAPLPPGYGAARSPGGFGDQASAFGGAIASPAPSNPFAPRPEPVAPAPPPAALPEPTTPERTLTRRELRAMLEAHSGEGFDEFDLDDPVAAPAPAPAAPQQVAAFPPQQAAPFPPQTAPAPPQSQSAPSRAPAPHQVAASSFADESSAAPKPVGHWTDQLNAPVERAEPFDQLLSRGGMSHGVPTTTNALILPTLPDHNPMGNSLAPSGEVIVTGSIDLPRTFGATGAHPSQIDSSDVDRLFDQVEDGAGVGAPVSATRAISTQSASRAMMAPPKKEGMNVPLVLAVTAGVLALGVVATLVIGAVSGLF